VWADDLEPWIGNPFPIETIAATGQAKVRRDIERLNQAMANRTNWSLLIYLEAKTSMGDAVAGQMSCTFQLKNSSSRCEREASAR